MSDKIDIHYHKFDIYAKFEFLFFTLRKHIGYEYMKCGVETKNGNDHYPEGLPKVVGIQIFGVGRFGEIPSNNEIQANKDDQVINV